MNNTVNYLGVSPSTIFLPLSAASASSPSILITGTSAAGQTTVHTGDANAIDVLFMTISNVSAATVTVYTNIGSTATTGQFQSSLTAGSWTVISNGNFGISGSGVAGMWATATAGVYALGYVARTLTATSYG